MELSKPIMKKKSHTYTRLREIRLWTKCRLNERNGLLWAKYRINGKFWAKSRRNLGGNDPFLMFSETKFKLKTTQPFRILGANEN